VPRSAPIARSPAQAPERPPDGGDVVHAGVPRLGVRIQRAARRPQAWWQLGRFGLVGLSGYAVNLATFALLVRSADVHYRIAATAAFLVAVTNNFAWNRRWTFAARAGRSAPQAARFLLVSVAAFLLNLAVLSALVGVAGVDELPAQALAIASATPVSFVANKLWTFGA
jgi:dolichol-phosphate mannosyltransferase